MQAERPGWDPRMNSKPYEVSLIDDQRLSDTLDVIENGVTGDILTISSPTPVAFSYSEPENNYVFNGTPDPMNAESLEWKQLTLQFSGTPIAGNSITLSLAPGDNGVLPETDVVQIVVPESYRSSGTVAQLLAAALPNGFVGFTRTSLLGDTRLFITQTDGTGFRYDLQLPSDSTSSLKAKTSGVPSQSSVGITPWLTASIITNKVPSSGTELVMTVDNTSYR